MKVGSIKTRILSVQVSIPSRGFYLMKVQRSQAVADALSQVSIPSRGFYLMKEDVFTFSEYVSLFQSLVGVFI